MKRFYQSVLVVALVAAPGCAHQLKFTSFGEMTPGADRTVVTKYGALQKKKSPAPSKDEVRVYMKTLPPGVSMEGGTFEVSPDSQRTLIGTFEWHGAGLLPSEFEASGELAKVAKAAGGNEVVVLEAAINQGYLNSAEGIIILHEGGTTESPAAPDAPTSI